MIAPDVVLTAAHCVSDGQYAGDGLAKVLKQRRVRLGSRGIGKGGQSFAIAAVAVHAGYDPRAESHDLALLLLRLRHLPLRQARLRFYRAAQATFARVLDLMGMSAPEVM